MVASWLPLLVPFAGLATPAVGLEYTCGDLKTFFNSEGCCGMPEKELSKTPAEAACPYSFAKPACANAEPQSPRDLTANAPGQKVPKAAVLNEEQAAFMPLTNVHYHLGAEHKSEAYSDGTDGEAYDADHDGRRLGAGEVRPGFMCSTSDLSETQLASYSFEHCTGDVQVGKSYEVHYVHSSAGYSQEVRDSNPDVDGIDDGLGGAANGRGLLNPMVVVQGQVFQIVQDADYVDDLLHGWTVVDHSDSVMYAGSTTGPSHDNEVCSPYSITWHVDKACHRVSPAAFDNLCKQMKDEYNLVADLAPHGSRKIVDQKWVVESQYVVPLA